MYIQKLVHLSMIYIEREYYSTTNLLILKTKNPAGISLNSKENITKFSHNPTFSSNPACLHLHFQQLHAASPSMFATPPCPLPLYLQPTNPTHLHLLLLTLQSSPPPPPPVASPPSPSSSPSSTPPPPPPESNTRTDLQIFPISESFHQVLQHKSLNSEENITNF